MRLSIENGLRRFFGDATEPARRRLGCLDDGEIAAFFDGKVTDGERERTEIHLEKCAFCREQVASLARMSEAELPETVPSEWLARARTLAESKNKSGSGWAWRWVAVAATAICVLVVAVVMLRRPGQRVPSAAVQNPASAPSLRGAATFSSVPELISPAPGARVPWRALEFRWKPVEGAEEYEISVLTADGDIVWKQSTQGTSAKLPGEVHLTPEQKYFVLIRASLREGKWARSKAAPFSVTDSH